MQPDSSNVERQLRVADMAASVAPVGVKWVKAWKTGGAPHVGSPDEFSFLGQVGSDSNLHPAVLETQSLVSGSVGRHRHMSVCPALSVV
jgi:hypothetical protein